MRGLDGGQVDIDNSDGAGEREGKGFMSNLTNMVNGEVLVSQLVNLTKVVSVMET